MVNVYKVTFLSKTNVKDTFTKKEIIHKRVKYVSSATENIKGIRFSFKLQVWLCFARVKDLVFLTCKAKSLPSRRAKSRMCGPERLLNA
jgi:hypothetical protein